MSEPRPAGSTSLTLVMTDVEGSTQLWAQFPDEMNAVMARHHAIVHQAVAAYGGWRPVDQGEGDAVFAAFDSPTAALKAVTDFQCGLDGELWPAGIKVRVRVGVHAGEVTVRDGNLFGSTVNRCARLRGLGAGGQVLLSAPVFELVRDRLPDGVTLIDLGEHRMKDLRRPERVYQLTAPGLPSGFPPLASLDRAQHNLPVHASSFIGRDREVADLVGLVQRERLVTITGFGGMGKTRLAQQVGAELANGDGDGVWFVDLSAVVDAAVVPSLIAGVLSVGDGADGALPVLLTAVASKRVVLIVDNLEQVLDGVAPIIDSIVSAGPEVRVLATSREPLRLRGEQVYTLDPLALPPVHSGAAWTDAELGSLSTYAAVHLFITRAAEVRRDFTLTASNASAIAAICARLDGLPLALELAAARTRALSPEALLPRLDDALKILTGGSRDLPSRHQTLRATIAWSFDALDQDEQHLLRRLAVFPGSFTLDAAEQVCGPALATDDAGLDVLDGLMTLVDRSLVRHEPMTETGADDRYSMLVSIRDFAAEHLERCGEKADIQTRHADFYRRLVTLPINWTPADGRRRRRASTAEIDNVRAALSLAHERGTAEQEMSLGVGLTSALMAAGHYTEAASVSDQALSRSEGPTLERFFLLDMRVAVEVNKGRADLARAFAARAVEEARALGDDSALVLALSDAAFVAPTRPEHGSLLAEAERLLSSLPSVSTVPMWLLRRCVDEGSAHSSVADPALAEAALRRLIQTQDESDADFYRLNLAIGLLNWGKIEESADAVAPFEQHDLPAGMHPAYHAKGAVIAATVRIVQGDVRAARVNLETADRALKSLEMPDMEVTSTVLHAALDRIEGHRSSAVVRLRRAVGHPVADIDIPRDLLGLGVWLLAVLAREAADPSEANRLLEEAWTSYADSYNTELVLVCLLERAWQIAATEPLRAVEIIGLVAANRGTIPFGYGVTYDTDAMLDNIRTGLGEHEVSSVLAGTEGRPLPVPPSWL